MREHDLVIFGATGFTGRLVAEYIKSRGRARALGDRRAQQGQARCPRVRRPRADRRRARSQCARRDREGVEGDLHDRRPVLEVRQRSRGRVRGERHALLRPHRRGALDARDDRPAPRARGAERCAHRPRVRVRLDPVRPRLLPRAAGDDRAHRCTRAHDHRALRRAEWRDVGRHRRERARDREGRGGSRAAPCDRESTRARSGSERGAIVGARRGEDRLGAAPQDVHDPVLPWRSRTHARRANRGARARGLSMG